MMLNNVIKCPTRYKYIPARCKPGVATVQQSGVAVPGILELVINELNVEDKVDDVK